MSVDRTQSRRRVLKTAGTLVLGAGGAVTLGACATDTTSDTSQPASGSSGVSAEQRSDGGFTVPVSAIPVGGGAILANADYVVTQPTAGAYKAFSKICTHQQCPVGSISGGAIVCPCHGSEFSISDGSVIQGPAQQPLAAAKATASGDDVIVAAG